MIKPILTYPSDKELLSMQSQKVKDINCEEVQKVIQDLIDTLHNTNGGKGLAAIQIGVPMQICICSWGNTEIVMINPVITYSRGSCDFVEGCLSVPGKYTSVRRAQKVTCQYFDKEGKECIIAQGGRMSDIIQHEIDHFNGICRVLE